jgi:hypothetical protein
MHGRKEGFVVVRSASGRLGYQRQHDEENDQEGLAVVEPCFHAQSVTFANQAVKSSPPPKPLWPAYSRCPRSLKKFRA